MSRTKNIGGVVDAHYRYTRPEFKVKEELRGTNGQRTVIENIEDVAKAVHVPPTYLVQFIGYELSVSARFQEKTKAGGRTCAVFAGIHSLPLLESLMLKFERIYVVCPRCKDGGTRLSVSQKTGVRIKCGACGETSPTKTPHKTDKFMEKHPPARQSSGLSVQSEESVAEEEDEKSEQPSAQKKVKAPKKPKEEQKEEREHKTPQQKVKDFIQSKKIEGSLSEVQVIELASELDRISLVDDLNSNQRVSTAIEGLIDFQDLKNLPSSCKQFAGALRRVAPDRSSKISLIASVMNSLSKRFSEDEAKGDHAGKFSSVSSMTLITLYEADVISEAAFREWHSLPPESDDWLMSRLKATECRTASKRFLEWLDTAEEED